LETLRNMSALSSNGLPATPGPQLKRAVVTTLTELPWVSEEARAEETGIGLGREMEGQREPFHTCRATPAHVLLRKTSGLRC
jgi:hypothetical protein